MLHLDGARRLIAGHGMGGVVEARQHALKIQAYMD